MKLALFAILGASLVTAGAAQAQQSRAHYNAASTSNGGYVMPPPGTAPIMSQSRAQTWYSDSGWQPGNSAIGTYGYNYGYGGANHSAPVVIAAPNQGQAYYSQAYGGQLYGNQAYYGVQRSQPFGYVVDGYGRYPWNRSQAYGGQTNQGPVYQDQGHAHHGDHHAGCGHQLQQATASQPIYYASPPVYVSQPPIYVQSPPVYVEAAQVHVAPAQVEVAPAQVYVAPPQVQTAPAQIHYDQGYFAVPVETPPPPPPPSPTERPYKQEPGERG